MGLSHWAVRWQVKFGTGSLFPRESQCQFLIPAVQQQALNPGLLLRTCQGYFKNFMKYLSSMAGRSNKKKKSVSEGVRRKHCLNPGAPALECRMQFLCPKGRKDTLRQGTVSMGEVVEQAGVLHWEHKRTGSLDSIILVGPLPTQDIL